MRAVRVVCICIVTSLLVPFESAKAAPDTDRPWSVQDSAGLRYFVATPETPAFWADDGAAEFIHASPDGRHFFLVSHRGDLACDCNRYELSVYDVSTIRKVLAHGKSSETISPLHTVEMNSTSNFTEGFGAIRQPVWWGDSTILFYGTGETGSLTGVFRFDIRSGELRRLTDAKHDVESASYRADEDSILYTAVTAQPLERDSQDLPVGYNKYPLQPVRGGGFKGPGLQPYLANSRFRVRKIATFAASSRGPVRMVAPFEESSQAYPDQTVRPTLSPDGRWGVVAVPVGAGDTIPLDWRRYDGLEAPFSLLGTDRLARLQRLSLVDISTATTRTIVDAPLGPLSSSISSFAPSTVLWSADSRHVVITNISLPLDINSSERQRASFLVSYDRSTEKLSVLEPMVHEAGAARDPAPVKVKKVTWIVEGRELLVTHSTEPSDSPSGTVYELKHGVWVSRAATKSTKIESKRSTSNRLTGGLTVSVRESANEPPIVIASEAGKEVVLIDKDPMLAGIRRVQQVEVEWTERDGHSERGGLLLPERRDSNRLPPLVIQIGYYIPTRFLPDGSASTAFAAQALAAQGVAVLQMSGTVNHSYSVEKKYDEEGDLIVQRIDAAVDMLTQRGLIDSKRVGLLGFSHPGFQVYYAITHPRRTRIAAALVADASSGSYGEYVHAAAMADREWVVKGLDRKYGGSFWSKDSRSRWLQEAPSFNVDRVDAPTLFSYHGELSAAASTMLEQLGAFRINNREIDILFFPQGEHQLLRPRQRVASLGATVDWMTFWLIGHEDHRSEKAEQYWYWRSLRSHAEARHAMHGAVGPSAPDAKSPNAQMP